MSPAAIDEFKKIFDNSTNKELLAWETVFSVVTENPAFITTINLIAKLSATKELLLLNMIIHYWLYKYASANGLEFKSPFTEEQEKFLSDLLNVWVYRFVDHIQSTDVTQEEIEEFLKKFGS